MAIQIGINGFGRIGRVAFRIAISQPERFHLCGINVRNADLDYMVYMIGTIPYSAASAVNLWHLREGDYRKWKEDPCLFRERCFLHPMERRGAEYIIDATGAFCTTAKAMSHIKAGAKSHHLGSSQG